MELIDRYVHAVGKRIPKKQREDIEKELKSLILDELEAKTKGRGPAEEDVAAVLKEMGHPAKVAAKYNAQEHGLIGPALLFTYFLVLKIVLASIALGFVVAAAINMIQAPADSGMILLRLIGQYITAGLGAIGGVTVVFAVLERVVPDLSLASIKGGEWDPKDLPPVPKKADEIKIGDSVAGLVFAIIAIVIFNFFLERIGIYYMESSGQMTFVPVFDTAAIAQYLPYWNAVWGLEFIRHVLLLVQGRERLGTRVFSLVMPVLSVIIAAIMLGGPAIISGRIVDTAAEAASFQTLKDIFAVGYRVVLVLAIVGSVVEFGKRIYGLVRSAA